MAVSQTEHTVLFYVAPSAAFSHPAPVAATAFTTPAAEVRGWHTKSVFIINEGGDPCTVSVEGSFTQLGGAFYPIQTASGGTAQPDQIFPFTVDGDLFDYLRVQIVPGATPPTKSTVIIRVSRMAP